MIATAPEVGVVRIGYVPLVDCAIIVAADRLGFAAEEGIRFELVREISWANIRDRIFVGHLDAAQMLAGLPIASTLGLNYLQQAMVAPLMLGTGGNAITVSNALLEDMGGAGISLQAPAAVGAAFAKGIVRRRERGAPRPVLAMVYPFSSHNYELRYWLAASGVDPDRDVELIVLPPPLMGDALASGRVDGFCVGEPWNSLAVAAGTGRIVAATAEIWRGSPDKALAMRKDWADAHPRTVAALVRACQKAAMWADDAHNHPALAEMLAADTLVGVPAAIIADVLAGRVRGPDGSRDVDGYIRFAGRAATFPWASHAVWLHAQMVRWGQATWSPAAAAAAEAVFRPDLCRAALDPLGITVPAADWKIEGAAGAPTIVAGTHGTLTIGPDGFFDGAIFDPREAAAYLQALGVAVG
ncbi:MAG: CmpA/NrtA family ABC transporter substrate-binding protein [Alphaproteobacteria bacterium]